MVDFVEKNALQLVKSSKDCGVSPQPFSVSVRISRRSLTYFKLIVGIAFASGSPSAQEALRRLISQDAAMIASKRCGANFIRHMLKHHREVADSLLFGFLNGLSRLPSEESILAIDPGLLPSELLLSLMHRHGQLIPFCPLVFKEVAGSRLHLQEAIDRVSRRRTLISEAANNIRWSKARGK